jgi:predicted RNase H-like HicB family nuclease
MSLEYPYTLEPQESGGFVVQFLDIEEAFTEGATQEECAFNAAEVLMGILGQRLADGAEIPLPGKAHPAAYNKPQGCGTEGNSAKDVETSLPVQNDLRRRGRRDVSGAESSIRSSIAWDGATPPSSVSRRLS